MRQKDSTMLTTLKTATIAGLIGLSALAAVPAKADSVYLGFGDRHDDARFGVYVGNDAPVYRRWSDRRWDERRGWRSGCSPDRALDKALDMGIHRPRIDFVSERR